MSQTHTKTTHCSIDTILPVDPDPFVFPRLNIKQTGMPHVFREIFHLLVLSFLAQGIEQLERQATSTNILTINRLP